MNFTKEDARRRVLNCAKQYRQKLLNKKMIIIYRERHDNAIRYIEVVFHERNYQHLTGLELIDENGNVQKILTLKKKDMFCITPANARLMQNMFL